MPEVLFKLLMKENKLPVNSYEYSVRLLKIYCLMLDLFERIKLTFAVEV